LPYSGMVAFIKYVKPKELIRGFHAPYKWLFPFFGVGESFSHKKLSPLPKLSCGAGVLTSLSQSSPDNGHYNLVLI